MRLLYENAGALSAIKTAVNDKKLRNFLK